jgi:molybdate transport system ATP-binding protein
MLLELKDVRLARDNFVIDITVRIDREICGIFGVSGSGKTSLMHLLSGLERPESGSIVFNGKELVNVERGRFIPAHRRQTGMVFQESRLFPHINVKKNLLFGHRYSTPGHGEPDFDDIVDMLELRCLLDSMPGSISGGESQRVALGRALLRSPELLLLDEPFSAMDFTLRKSLLPFLWKIRNELNIPMLVISHDLPDILALTDNLLLIERGKVAGHGSISTLALEPYAFGLLKASGVVSVMDMEVTGIEDNGMVRLYQAGAAFTLRAAPMPGLTVGQRLRVAIPPEDVIICDRYLSGTSIGNIIPGTIIHMGIGGGDLICQIDTGGGILLLAEFTVDALDRLDLKPGKEVYCMIRENSISLSRI